MLSYLFFVKVHISDDKEVIYDGEKTTVIKNHDPPPKFNRGRGPNFFRGRFRGRRGGNRFPRNQLRRFDGGGAYGNSGKLKKKCRYKFKNRSQSKL